MIYLWEGYISRDFDGIITTIVMYKTLMLMILKTGSYEMTYNCNLHA